VTARLDLERVLEILEGDRSLFDELVEHGLLEEGRHEFLPEEAERARVARTLVRELEVNWEGTEIILRLREELIETRHELAELLGELRRRLR
jgi:hypothetical protein